MIRVSFVVTFYNAEKTINSCVQSILEQTYEDIEVIAIDDGSTDDSLSLVRKIDDPRIRVFSDGRLGRVEALNKGLEAATGIYIAILDADDEVLPNRITKQVQFLQENPDTTLVYSNVLLMNKEGETFGETTLNTSASTTNQRLLDLNPFAHSSVLFRRDDVLAVGGYNKRCERSIDFNLYLELLIYKKVIKGIPDSLTKLRVYEDSWGKAEGSSLQFFYGSLGLFNYYNTLKTNKNILRAGDPEYHYFYKKFEYWYAERRVLQLIMSRSHANKALENLKHLDLIGVIKNLYMSFRNRPDFWNIRKNPVKQLGDFNEFYATLDQ